MAARCRGFVPPPSRNDPALTTASITVFGLAVVRQFEMMGVYCLNESQAIARSRDKLRCLQILSRHDIGLPPTIYTRQAEHVPGCIEKVEGQLGVGNLYDLVSVNPQSLAQRRADWVKFIKVWNKIDAFVRDPATQPEAIKIMAARAGVPARVWPARYATSWSRWPAGGPGSKSWPRTCTPALGPCGGGWRGKAHPSGRWPKR